MKFTASHPLPDSSNEVCALCARDSGCNACFDELIGRLRVPLMHHLLQRARNRQDAEDILQETWLAAYRNIGKYNAGWRFTTWIFTIAHRQAISAARKPTSSASELAGADGNVPAPGQGPDEAAAQSEMKDSLWAKAKDILDTDAFTAVWLTYVEGMSADEVGTVIDRNANGDSCQDASTNTMERNAMRNVAMRVRFEKIVTVLVLMLTTAGQAAAKPLKVFILAGQSNMQGHVNVSTFDSMADDPKTAVILKEMRDADRTPRACKEVWISSIGCADNEMAEQKGKLTVGFGASSEEIGPEFTFGIYTEKMLGEPILIIKTSWGGKNLHTDFRPPSAGPYVWSDYELAQCKQRGDDLEKIKAEKIEATGLFYRHMVEHVRKVLADIKRVVPEYDANQGYELAGFVWFQGFNDLVSDWTYEKQMKPGGYDLYGQLLAQLIRDVRKDLSVPKMPFVIGVMGIGGVPEGKKPPQKYFRQAQGSPTLLPEFKGNVVAVQTASFWDDDLDALSERWEMVTEKLAHTKTNESLSMEERITARIKAVDEIFTPAELKRWRASTSNWGYHYLGAAKIMAPIGKAFAEALVKLHSGNAVAP